MNKERIQARIAELERERDEFIKESNLTVNTRIGAFNGAIAELKRLLIEDADEDTGEADG